MDKQDITRPRGEVQPGFDRLSLRAGTLQAAPEATSAAAGPARDDPPGPRRRGYRVRPGRHCLGRGDARRAWPGWPTTTRPSGS